MVGHHWHWNRTRRLLTIQESMNNDLCNEKDSGIAIDRYTFAANPATK